MLMKPIEYLDSKYGAIKKKIDSDWFANYAVWQMFQTQANLDVRLEAGDTSLLQPVGPLTMNTQTTQYYFNRTRPLCNMVSGRQRQERKSPVVVPLDNGAQETADQYTDLLLGIYKRENVPETISEAFHQGACMTGMNLLHLYLDWSNDPVSGDIKVKNYPYNAFYIDPYFRDPSLCDANFVYIRTFLTHEEAANLMPEYYKEIMDLPGNPTGMGRDNRFMYMPEASGQTFQNRLAYDEYYYRAFREQEKLIDKQTGEVFEVPMGTDIDTKMFLRYNPQITLIKQNIPTVRLAIQIQGKVFYCGPQPTLLDEFPFIPVVGYYNAMMPTYYTRIQGICRSLRDPQLLLNRRIVLSADLIESQLNSGWIVKEDTMLDINHLLQTGQGKILAIKKGASMDDIRPMVPPQIPQSFFQLQETFSKELNMVTGISDELMGMASDENAGITKVMNQGAALVTLKPLFDRLDLAQNLLNTKMMRMIQLNYTPGKVKTMLQGKEPSQHFYRKEFGKYHCTLELSFNTETQRQVQFAQLLQLQQLGIQIPPKTLIQAATVQNKEQLIKDIEEQQQQQQQMQQQQNQLQMQKIQAETELAKARSVADRGLGLERASRVQENQALAEERKAAAVKDDQAALLDFAKAMKELESIDINHLEKIISLKKILSDISQANNATNNNPGIAQQGVGQLLGQQ
jgi:hypothetical protein